MLELLTGAYAACDGGDRADIHSAPGSLKHLCYGKPFWLFTVCVWLPSWLLYTGDMPVTPESLWRAARHLVGLSGAQRHLSLQACPAVELSARLSAWSRYDLFQSHNGFSSPWRRKERRRCVSGYLSFLHWGGVAGSCFKSLEVNPSQKVYAYHESRRGIMYSVLPRCTHPC